MFVPIEQATWPAAGEVRELRVSLNAPVLLGPGPGAWPTRAALGWLPDGAGASIRLWLRADGAPRPVRAFDLPEAPVGPAARAAALERAERFLAGLGFLFPAASEPRRLRGDEPRHPRTSDPDPEGARPVASGQSSAVRADVRPSHRSGSGPAAAVHRPGPRRPAGSGASRTP
jgi:hypothetical protein